MVVSKDSAAAASSCGAGIAVGDTLMKNRKTHVGLITTEKQSPNRHGLRPEVGVGVRTRSSRFMWLVPEDHQRPAQPGETLPRVLAGPYNAVSAFRKQRRMKKRRLALINSNMSRQNVSTQGSLSAINQAVGFSPVRLSQVRLNAPIQVRARRLRHHPPWGKLPAGQNCHKIGVFRT